MSRKQPADREAETGLASHSLHGFARWLLPPSDHFEIDFRSEVNLTPGKTLSVVLK
jgi:hypothetical protein